MVAILDSAYCTVLLCTVAAGLWGIVNNAGICYLADLEMTSEKLFRKVLDVNLLGLISVTKAFLPLVRQAKGRIVNMSSIAGYNIYLVMCDDF